MPRLSPLRSEEIFSKLRKLGYEGPRAGGRHSRMVHPETGHIIPVPTHKWRDVKVGVVRSIIRMAGITVEEWLDL